MNEMTKMMDPEISQARNFIHAPTMAMTKLMKIGKRKK